MNPCSVPSSYEDAVLSTLTCADCNRSEEGWTDEAYRWHRCEKCDEDICGDCWRAHVDEH